MTATSMAAVLASSSRALSLSPPIHREACCIEKHSCPSSAMVRTRQPHSHTNTVSTGPCTLIPGIYPHCTMLRPLPCLQPCEDYFQFQSSQRVVSREARDSSLSIPYRHGRDDVVTLTVHVIWRLPMPEPSYRSANGRRSITWKSTLFLANARVRCQGTLVPG